MLQLLSCANPRLVVDRCRSLRAVSCMFLQAEAAAKLAQYQRGLRQLLASIGSTGNIADDAQLLYNLADQLFGSPVNVCELVAQGGVPVILSAAKSALAALTGDDARVDVLPALMQVGASGLQDACRNACRKLPARTACRKHAWSCKWGAVGWNVVLVPVRVQLC